MININYKVLKNGLRVVAEKIPYVKSVSFGVWFNVGSRMETSEESGIAHFIEHMMFKGTANRSAKDISNDINYFGGNINAFTTHDFTCYHVKMPYNHIDRGIDVLSDILRNSLFLDVEIEKEKLVISEEIRMYEDSPEDYVYEELLKRAHKNKGISRSILGTQESISKIDRNMIKNFFSKFYVPNNAVVVVSGNFDVEELFDKIEKNFSGWEKIDVLINREGQNFYPVKFIKNRDDEQANIAIVFKCPDDSIEKDFFAVKLLGNIFGSSSSSRLFQHIREEKGLSYNTYSSDNFYVGYAEFGIFSSVAIENLNEVFELIMSEIETIKKGYISESELIFAKEQYKGSVLMNVEDTEDRMLLIGEYEVNNRRLKTIDEIIDIVDSIDLDYMKDIIDKIFQGEMAIGVTGRSVTKIMKLR